MAPKSCLTILVSLKSTTSKIKFSNLGKCLNTGSKTFKRGDKLRGVRRNEIKNEVRIYFYFFILAILRIMPHSHPPPSKFV